MNGLEPLLSNPRTWLILAVLLAVYLFGCWFWPYKPCKKCDGKGRFTAPLSNAWRACPRCSGSGRRVRTGRKLLRMVKIPPPD